MSTVEQADDATVARFMSVTGCDLVQARFLLEATNGNFENAAQMYYGKQSWQQASKLPELLAVSNVQLDSKLGVLHNCRTATWGQHSCCQHSAYSRCYWQWQACWTYTSPSKSPCSKTGRPTSQYGVAERSCASSLCSHSYWVQYNVILSTCGPCHCQLCG